MRVLRANRFLSLIFFAISGSLLAGGRLVDNDYLVRSLSFVSLKSPTAIARMLDVPWVTAEGPKTHNAIILQLMEKKERTPLENQTLFEYAIYCGDPAIVKAIPNDRINPNIELGVEQSVFEWKREKERLINLAAYYSHWEMVDLLMDCHASAELHPTDLTSVLGWTMLWNNRSMYEKVLASGVNPRADHTLPWAACGSGDALFYMEQVLGFGHSVNAVAPSGLSLLETAVVFGNLELVKLLVGHGAKIDYTDIVGRTAISLARQHGRTEIEKFLSEKQRERSLDDGLFNLDVHPVIIPPLLLKAALEEQEK